MRVGILGSGLMGGKLGTLFARAGPEVVFPRIGTKAYRPGPQKRRIIGAVWRVSVPVGGTVRDRGHDLWNRRHDNGTGLSTEPAEARRSHLPDLREHRGA